MIIIKKLPREDSIAQELRAIEDKKKEETPLEGNSRMSFWIILMIMTVIIFTAVSL